MLEIPRASMPTWETLEGSLKVIVTFPVAV